MNDITDAKGQLLATYADYYEKLSLETIDQLKELVTDDFVFCDPFTTVRGPDAVCAYLAKAFTDADHPRFIVTHRAIDQDRGFLRWRFSARVKVIGNWEFTGMSEVTFNDDGTRLASHFDHWDSGQNFYAKIPVLSWFIQRLARRVGSL
jgi:hypothetical protein